jgi:hypothetical protein
MRKKLELVGVRLIPWDVKGGVYGVACEYDNGFTSHERWGSFDETVVAVSMRERNIASHVSFKRASRARSP